MSIHIVATIVAGSILAILPADPAFAQSRQPARDTIVPAKDSIRFHTLHEVIVRSGKSAASLTSPAPVQILTSEVLKKMNSLSVADAVRYFSGVQLKDYGGIGGLKTVNIRSMGTNHTAVFYDGIQVSNAQNGQVDLGKFSVDNIEEIALYNGQKNSLLQPAKGFSSAGSLYLKPRRPSFTGQEKTHASIKFKTGSFGLLNPSLGWQQKINQHIYSSVSSEWIRALGNYPFRYTNGVYDTTAKRHNADIDAWRVEAGLHGLMADSSEWTIRLYSYWSGRGLPGAIVSNVFKRGQRQWDRNLFAQFSWSKKLGDRYRLLINTKYAYDYLRYHDPEFTNIQGYLDNRYRQQEFYFSVAQQYQIKSWWEVSLAGDFQVNHLEANLQPSFAAPTRYTTLAAAATRLYGKRFEGQASLLGTFVQDRVQSSDKAGDKQAYTPTIMASWQPFADPGFRLRAFYKNIFRMPTFNDLYYTYIGNTLLRPEFTHQYNIGFTYNKACKGPCQFISVQADAYYNEVTDKIVAIPTANLYRWTMINLDKVGIKGIDISAQSGWQLFAAVDVTTRLSYTWQQAEDRTPGGDNYKHQIPYIPWHSGSLTTSAVWKSWDLHYSFIYTGERYNQKTNIPENYVEPWYTHDGAIARRFTFGKTKTATITGEVNNIFNQYYDVVINFPMPGRHYRLTFQVQL